MPKFITNDDVPIEVAKGARYSDGSPLKRFEPLIVAVPVLVPEPVAPEPELEIDKGPCVYEFEVTKRDANGRILNFTVTEKEP